MSPLKQIAIVFVLFGVGAASWLTLAPGTFPASFAALQQGGEGGDAQSARRGRRGGMGREVRVITAEVAEIASGTRVQAIGTAEAVQSVTLYPETTGIVAEVAFRAGDKVEAGQPLLRLDDAEQRILVEQARVELQTAQDALARGERLSQSQAVSAVAVQEARAAVAGARNALATAELNLARRTITAPFAGTMGIAQASVGDMLTTTTAIGNIDDRQNLFVEFVLPERYAALAGIGQAITASTAAYPGEEFGGEVEALDSRIDPVARTLTVRAAVPNEDDRLRPGMAFNVVMTFTGTEHPAVPQVAVQWDRQGAFVWKLVDGKARRTAVEVVERTGGMVLVEGDLGVDELVVAEGVQRLREGLDVTQVAQTDGEPATPAAPTRRL